MAQYIKTEEGYKEFAAVTDDKMDKTDPTGTGSFSMNRKAGTVIGVNSHAEGSDTTASDYYSHAEGSETVASGYISHAEGYQTTASGIDSHAEGYKTTASGSYSHAEGFGTVAKNSNSHAEGIDTTAIGFSSHAEGGSTNKFSSVVTTTHPTTDSIITAWETKKFSVANGYYSHVEGKDNLALDDYSHAEGYQTTASGENSHAEGYQTIASKNYSHAEGSYTTASGHSSHAEGSSTTAIGYHSHAEGNQTTASGFSSHAEGSYTKAPGSDSHVQGKFNIEDTSSIYADIIGNGTSNTARSNAATVDWNGNAWFAGDVYVGSTSGTNKDNGSKKLATEEYVNSSIAAGGTDISLGLTSAAVGQIIKVKAVDESGKPTAWEAADMAGGESSFPKFEKLLTHTITEEEIAANPIAFVWGTAQIPNLNDFNVFTLTIRNPDDTTKITFTKWVRLKINNVLMGNICGTSQGEGYKYSISANRLYGFWVSDNMYNPNNDDTNVLTPPYSRHGFDSNIAASEAVTSIGFTSYNTDYGLTAGIIVEIWGAK